MPLSWNEIRDRAHAFSKEWADASSEGAEAQPFWDSFFRIFDVTRRRVATFETRIKRIDGRDGYIDLLWKGVILVEHKSRGKDLDHAYGQALSYFPGLKERDLPRFVLVSDFARFRLYDLDAETDEDKQFEFPIEALHENVNRFAFIAGYQTHKIKEQDPVNIEAAELMGKLHDKLQGVGYIGHGLEMYLVRLLFCLFAEDTGIFERQQFRDYIELRTGEDGADLGPQLDTLFYILNTPDKERLDNRDEQISAFPFVNGKLFEERLRPAAFDSPMRESLLQCCSLDWGRISPAIFGSLFQSIMDKDARRNLGAHYTSEENILKLINPLFMDDLRAEFQKVKNNQNKLFEFHKKLRSLKFLDPACGCGNFLVIAYRELRLLELEILRVSRKGMATFDVHALIALDVDQFYGIEIEEFPAQIAQVAMWLMDHQMNTLISQEFGMYFARIPLNTSANIVHGNALRTDWRKVIAPEQLSFIMGNPPFIGKNFQSKEQKQDMQNIYGQSQYSAGLDYVTAWYKKSLHFMKPFFSANKDVFSKPKPPPIKCAFVSTNSITQGEQVYMLWPDLLAEGIHIHFAHRTFKWTNEARGKAAVYCVIIGFGLHESKTKRLFEYEDVQGKPHEIRAANINPYLVDAANVIIPATRTPICDCPKMINGSKSVDGNHLLLDEEEKDELLEKQPEAAEWIKPYSMGNEFIKGISRFCLWLKDCPPEKLRKMPHVMKRVEAVREMRRKSADKNTQKFADRPTVFMADRQSENPYLAIPRVSSERRIYIPIGFLQADHIAGDQLQTVPNASLYHFGIITSLMHMAWMRTVCGKLKSDYRYSNVLVYNNFPWPKDITEKQTTDIKTKAQAILDARAKYPDSTLADLYDPLAMPSPLLKAHQSLDKSVDRAYRKTPFNNESDRVAYLFDLHREFTAPLIPKKKRKRVRRRI